MKVQDLFDVVIADDAGNIHETLVGSASYSDCCAALREMFDTLDGQSLVNGFDLMVLSCTTGRFVSYSV